MATPDYFNRKPSYTRSRPSALTHQGAPATPASPRTPLLSRSLSSQYGSPSSFRVDEECLIYEIGARSFRAGFASENTPRCILGFGPDESRRVGDFRPWMPGANVSDAGLGQNSINSWGKDWQLWHLDVRRNDLGLVEDKLERAVRNAHTHHLMLDQRQRKAVVVLPTALPHPLVEVVLATVFRATQPSTITIWNPPVLATVAAGLRSALVIDIGWHETTTTAVYEYRQVLTRRTVRGASMLTRAVADMMQEKGVGADIHVSFETAEDIVSRMAWCQDLDQAGAKDGTSDNDPISVPIKTGTSLQIPFRGFAKPAETVFFDHSSSSEHPDDHDLPLHLLAYKCLLALPLDVRAICMSRIIVTGGASSLPGLKQRLLQEIEQQVKTKAWDQVMNYGSATEPWSKKTAQSQTLPVREKPPDGRETGAPLLENANGSGQVRAADVNPERDDITDKLNRESSKREPVVQGVVRGVETLGAWAGASLIANLRVESVLEIRKDEFLKHGLASIANML